MFNPRTALVLVAPLVCAALVACEASVGEEVRITGESEPAATSSDPAAPAEPSQAHSDPTLVPTPSGPSEPTGGAASEHAPAIADASVDASVGATTDAGADVAPKPTFSCVAPTMWSNAPSTTCAQSSITTPGGTFAPGGYYLSAWWSSNKAMCTGTSDTVTRKGTMYIELIDGVTYMRWAMPGRVPPSGTARLTPTDTKVERMELCGASLAGTSTTFDYAASSTQIVLKNAYVEERWTRIPKVLDPKYPIDPITK
jgi:hypothetical protein